eukprot:CAMPEP_0204874476 /NCGR_PEP_ID=MMETSP1348-20121228/43136_1 /ASSEMBLY_ACC=CAM_ASM_000700 /TAXON_ID=215587 /ORGANISM="Aplanochytrium stocchinoi, Strain GSBS06" /LENGTH=406 /DNA_ID=CAMNT_0052030285 /DNA_START=186 /DNA_END=1406 /DNA_ORIENTATION=+
MSGCRKYGCGFCVTFNRIKNAPLSGLGLSLGSVGAGVVVNLLSTLLDWPYMNYLIAIPLYTLAASYITFYLIQAACFPSQLLKNFQDSHAISGYAALAMAIALAFQSLFEIIPFSVNVLWASAAFLFLIMLPFLKIVLWDKLSFPEPDWFPPLVGVAILGWTGVLADSSWSFVETMIWMPTIFTFLLLPPVVYHVLKDDQNVKNSTVNILQAPVPLVSIVWFQVGGSTWFTEYGNMVMIYFLFCLANVAFGICCYAVFVRRKDLWNQMGHAWAGFTFPTISTCNMSLQFWNCLRTENSVTCRIPLRLENPDAQRRTEIAVLVWASLLCCVLLPIVIVILFGSTAQLLYFIVKKQQNETPSATDTQMDQTEKEKKAANITNTTSRNEDVVLREEGIRTDETEKVAMS